MKHLIEPRMTSSEAINRLMSERLGILLVCDPGNRLLGVITDGDARRSVLAHFDLNRPSLELANRTPVTSPPGLNDAQAIHRMNTGASYKVEFLPILDERGSVIDLLFLRELLESSLSLENALLMAGGFGRRLYPKTKHTPKPMLKIGGIPAVERTVRKLTEAGIKNIYISTHFLGEKIRKHFGDGRSFGVNVQYVEEVRPLGTAGAISLLPELQGTLLIINADVLTDVNFRAMLEFHREHRADMTVAVRKYARQVPYGVVNCRGHLIEGIEEKPTSSFFVNAGVYLIEAEPRKRIPKDAPVSMTDFIANLIQSNHQLVAFPIIEYWIDIGVPEDYKMAHEHYSEKKVVNLG
ncbi:MAG: nucleotidyltransferase family protein [Deltaproteobacteria bacterium]|nr:nucleotidyltransferase family protein [Deltaproteobacteria bacterium]MBI3295912.1 nucleotidyltransferase family protein [Deltaproteobacteria bacterium]